PILRPELQILGMVAERACRQSSPGLASDLEIV
ncbi:hypothetical protein A2U01_0118212, partial [Trifolium medium]|nr:hypothetical protein [Trifolium medium]